MMTRTCDRCDTIIPPDRRYGIITIEEVESEDEPRKVELCIADLNRLNRWLSSPDPIEAP